MRYARANIVDLAKGPTPLPGRDRSVDRAIDRSGVRSIGDPIEDGVVRRCRLFDVTTSRARDRRGRRRARGGDRTRRDDVIHTRARIYTLPCAREREREDEDDERAWISEPRGRRLESIAAGAFEVDLISRG